MKKRKKKQHTARCLWSAATVNALQVLGLFTVDPRPQKSMRCYQGEPVVQVKEEMQLRKYYSRLWRGRGRKGDGEGEREV